MDLNALNTTITFDNYTIRPICIEDASNYYSFVAKNKDRLTKYFPNTLKANKDISSSTANITERIKLAEQREFFTFVILDNITGHIIGSVFIKNLDWNIPKGEMGYFVDKDYEGKGIITKAASLITDFCFSTLGLNKVFMRIAQDNISSMRVAEKNNFQAEGILRRDFKTSEGKLIDVVYYGILKPAE